LEKNYGWRKNLNDRQKLRWRIFSEQKFIWNAILRLCEKYFFWCKSGRFMYLKNIIWEFGFWQNGVRNLYVRNFAQNSNFQSISKSLIAFQASIYYPTFIEETLFKNPKLRIFRRWRNFWEKSTFVQNGLAHPPKLIFFKFSKIYQKNMPKKIFQYGGYFQNGVCSLFLHENMSCDRYFS
jgi:hypothetical protein